jgi:hypothetical protein
VGYISYVPPMNGRPNCQCVTPTWSTAGAGALWRCDNCGRLWERTETQAQVGAWVDRTA